MKAINTETGDMILVLGGTGKTGRRIVERLKARGETVRIGSRAAELPFDWQNRSTWEAVLKDVAAVYMAFHPDLTASGAADTIRAFSEQAAQSGVKRLVLLSGRGEAGAQRCEQIVKEAGLEWTILRCAWFCQNFSEDFLYDMVMSGTVALPVDEVKEPFIDADDIADVAVEALTTPHHAGQLYELTGPRLLTFAEAVGEIAKATGRQINYVPITFEAFAKGLVQQKVPTEMVNLLDLLFNEVLDGRNAHLTDGVQRALGRPPRDLKDYAKQTAAAGGWKR